MRIAALAMTLFLAAFLLHWVLWRIRVPRRQSAALLVIMLAALPVGLAVVTYLPALQFLRSQGFWEIVQVCTFYIAMTLAYVVAYSAIEGRSPSMTLLSYAADSRGRGRTRMELQAVLRSDDPVVVRLDALVRDNMIARRGDCYALTAKGWVWARCFGAFRRLLQMQKGG
jgi:hypothetical protein